MWVTVQFFLDCYLCIYAQACAEAYKGNRMKNTVIGILAHVDAGKTTLSEGLLYASGMIRKRGRVDKQDAYLDMEEMERERGITIFSKQAMIVLPQETITLLDTPGHVDFSTEMERTLLVLDYAILVISGPDGIQGHTKTLWNLLLEYQVPVFLFINKMDQPETEERQILKELKKQLSDNCVAFYDTKPAAFLEEAAMGSEEALEEYLETGTLQDGTLSKMIAERNLFPCYFGSALKYTGVEEFLEGICTYTLQKAYPAEFGAKVFKIARDEAGGRLTYLKVTGGSLKVRAAVRDRDKTWEEKASQLRIYSGKKYETIEEAEAGTVCAVTGLSKTFPGEGLGIEEDFTAPLIEPVLTYQILLPEGADPIAALPKLRELEEEDPRLHLIWNETHQEILVQVMGEVQTQVLKRQAWDRFGIDICFDKGHILYKETIGSIVEGVGHFEPLRHYAEVHLILEPGSRGSGLACEANCREELLDKNWQRLILTHIMEKEHVGVLTGSAITDLKITLAAGRAHQKHTEGGDFRQAVYRAIRQGLMQAESILLEPYHTYRLEVPVECIGRAMTDLKLCHAISHGPEIEDGMAYFTGRVPIATIGEYAKEVTVYTKGRGRILFGYGGYDACHNAEEVIAKIGYDPSADVSNPSSSVFCAHGAGYLVEWDRVHEFMHAEGVLKKKKEEEGENGRIHNASGREKEFLATEEVDAIIAKTYGANRRDKSIPRKGYQASRRITAQETGEAMQYRVKQEKPKEEYLLVDGYNMIYAWEPLKELSKENMDGARGRLLDLLCDYQGMKKIQLIVVFDAYRVAGHATEIFDYHNIHVVYTKEAETADAYIEKFAHENGKKYKITVATSDGLEQIIIRGAGCLLLSARELSEEMEQIRAQMRQEHLQPQKGSRRYLFDEIKEEVGEQLKAITESEE